MELVLVFFYLEQVVGYLVGVGLSRICEGVGGGFGDGVAGEGLGLFSLVLGWLELA